MVGLYQDLNLKKTKILSFRSRRLFSCSICLVCYYSSFACVVALCPCVFVCTYIHICVGVFAERRDARQQVQGAAAAGPRLWIHLQFDRQEPRKEGGRGGCWQGLRQGLRDPCPIPQGRRARPAGERDLQLIMRRNGSGNEIENCAYLAVPWKKGAALGFNEPCCIRRERGSAGVVTK